jgi:hypothetical protein
MRTILILLLLLAPLSLFATDFGITNENTVTIRTDPANFFFEKEKASLWFKFDLSDYVFINVGGYYEFQLQKPWNFYSVDTVEFRADFPVIGEHSFLFGFSVGRFLVSEFSGLVFAHSLDGGRLLYRNALFNLQIAGGFTGFLFKGESSLDMSIADNIYSTSPFLLVPPRLVGVIGLTFPELFLYQTLDIAAVGQLDRHADSTVLPIGSALAPDYSNGGKIDSLYTGIRLSGPIFTNFYWEGFFYFEFGRTLSYFNSAYSYSPIYAFLGGLKIDWYFPEALRSKLELQAFIASGDGDYQNYLEGNTDAYSLQFTPMTRPTTGLVYTMQITNAIIVQLEYSLKPFMGTTHSVWDNFQLSLMATGFFRAARSPVSDSVGLNASSLQYYLGSEIDLTATFKPMPDLGLQLSTGLFLPNNYTSASAFLATRNIEYLARIMVTINL